VTTVLTREVIEEVREAAHILEVVASYVSMRKRGSTYVGLCPFHTEKTPSFTVSEEKQIFHCFGCGAGGSVFDFLMRVRNLTFKEAVIELANRYGVTLPEKRESFAQKRRKELAASLYAVNEKTARFYHSLLLEDQQGTAAREYLEKRGIGKEIVNEFQLGYAPARWDGLKRFLLSNKLPLDIGIQAGLLVKKGQNDCYDRFRHRLVFPIRDRAGKVVGFGGRSLDETLPKYLNSPETLIFRKGRVLYGAPAARASCREHGEVLLVEGYFDVLALHSYGIHNVVAPLGTALTVQHVRLLRHLAPKAVLVFDGDQAGQKAAFRSLELFLREKIPVRNLRLPESMDPDDFLANSGRDAFLLLLDRAQPLLEAFLEVSLEKYDGSVESKVEVVRSVAAVLRLVDSRVAQDSYLRMLAQRLNASEEALRRELGWHIYPVKSRAKLPQQESQVRVPSMEEVVIRILFHYPQGVPLLKESQALQFFEGSGWKRLGENLLKQYEADGSVDFSRLVSELDDAEMKKRVTAWSLEESPWREDDVRVRLPEYLEGIKQRGQRRSTQLRRLQQRIHAAEQAKDDELLRQLLAEKAALLSRGANRTRNFAKGGMD